jgi:hypothetical protein
MVNIETGTGTGTEASGEEGVLDSDERSESVTGTSERVSEMVNIETGTGTTETEAEAETGTGTTETEIEAGTGTEAEIEAMAGAETVIGEESRVVGLNIAR